MILGVDGQDDAASAPLRPAVRLPAKLAGVAILPDGRPRGLDLPSLDVRGAAAAWRAALGRGAVLAWFEDRAAEPALERVQRLARVGDVWLDGPVHGVDEALDLLVAGAGRLVLRGDDAQLLEAVGDSAALAWDGSRPFADVRRDADAHGVPVIAYAAPPAADRPDLYLAPPMPWSGAVDVPAAAPLGEDEEE